MTNVFKMASGFFSTTLESEPTKRASKNKKEIKVNQTNRSIGTTKPKRTGRDRWKKSSQRTRVERERKEQSGGSGFDATERKRKKMMTAIGRRTVSIGAHLLFDYWHVVDGWLEPRDPISKGEHSGQINKLIGCLLLLLCWYKLLLLAVQETGRPYMLSRFFLLSAPSGPTSVTTSCWCVPNESTQSTPNKTTPSCYYNINT